MEKYQSLWDQLNEQLLRLYNATDKSYPWPVKNPFGVDRIYFDGWWVFHLLAGEQRIIHRIERPMAIAKIEPEMSEEEKAGLELQKIKNLVNARLVAMAKNITTTFAGVMFQEIAQEGRTMKGMVYVPEIVDEKMIKWKAIHERFGIPLSAFPELVKTAHPGIYNYWMLKRENEELKAMLLARIPIEKDPIVRAFAETPFEERYYGPRHNAWKK
jgi:hypothetical protein